MSGATKLMTSGAGGVIVTPTGTLSSDITVNVPTAGVNNGTLACTDANGNLGLGVTPSAWSVGKAIEIGYLGNAFLANSQNTNTITQNAYYNGGWKYASTAASSIYQQNTGEHVWYNAGSGSSGSSISWTQAMTLDSSGNLLVGTTSANERLVVVGTTNNYTISCRAANTSGTYYQMAFVANGSNVGAITSTTTATTYATSSDYRLKENIQPMQNALGVVAQLNPVTYTWKADGSDGQGFIAHELQAVVPDCVTGEKDAVDDNGNPVYQGIDTSFLVATLTKAIQELNEKVEAQAAEIAALKGAA